MASVDPTKIHVQTTTPPIWEQEQTFQEIMAEQLRHAPWVMLSIVIHAVGILLIYLMPATEVAAPKAAIQMQPQVEDQEIVEAKPPEP